MTTPSSDARDRALIRETALDETLVVEAAAGTGKTTELVSRIVMVLATGRARISEIVAVTFTEKAAGELKLRLREAVERARREAAGGALANLDAALRHLEEAHVTTIHGFCADMLRARPVEAGVDPRFEVLTEAQAARLYNAVFDRWLQEQLADPAEGVRRVLRRRSWSTEEAGAVERLRQAGHDLLDWRDFEAEWPRPEFPRASRIDAVLEELRGVADLLRDPANKYDTLHQSTRPMRLLVEDVTRIESVAPRDYDGLEAQLAALARDRDLSRLRKGSGASYRPGVTREDVWAAIERARGSLDTFRMEADADLAACLQRDLRGLARSYAEAKASAGALDFLDLLLQARNLIRSSRDARAGFQRRFARIFVDEFQDTDPLQAEILLLLAADDPSVDDWTSARPMPGKLFLVGDPKQSIYRFRRADVSVYRAVYERLEGAGARRVTLRRSFRARPNIQRAINAAFAGPMAVDDLSQQPGYVPLEAARADDDAQPSVVVLPVPEPYAARYIAAPSIERSLPDAVGAFVDWLLHASGWLVDRDGTRARVRAGDICVLFRRFLGYTGDVTRPYIDALEARGIPHLLVGGRSFHNRAEVEALRAALSAIERPDDELSVFAALRGPFFGVGDEELLRYRQQFGRFHPFHVPLELQPDAPIEATLAPLQPIAEALSLLQQLHRRRNRVDVASTIQHLLEATRVHVRFALERGGEQVLANVLHVADLARQYEADGGISFRGFLEEFDDQAEHGRSEEAPILEEGSNGVRLMTVHKAKGLEFPVVILADMTAKLRRAQATRYLDPAAGLCAIPLAGCVPEALLLQAPVEIERDAAEGVRVAYVAATRARDLLVVPAVGDEEREGWVEPLNAAVYPPRDRRRSAAAAPGCPAFRSKDSVLRRPDGDAAGASTVSPGLHHIGTHGVVWWDPRALHLGATETPGLRHADLISKKDARPEEVDAGAAAYRAWREAREQAIARGAAPSLVVETVTHRVGLRQGAGGHAGHDGPDALQVETIRIESAAPRPPGRRFGTLVHGVLAALPLDSDAEAMAGLAASLGRILGATRDEVAAAAARVQAALGHELIARARIAARAGRCRREVPVTWVDDTGAVLEGVVDLAFADAGVWTVVDFKTEAFVQGATKYERQVALYAAAVGRATGKPTAGILMYL